ncbi:TonB-linked SusC/RagA family outer membrane protein [Chitinophaga dinghuensis]|uniref:TonB-linked SusC/RagA family outer membrane protein n=1 Tax=Chitinophaga dinghuensis TaxID=1539050 RepID=A0A327WAP3_9BACT|nr:SusC/RagA family TonB-linked outer membrane protein [Chitinophaga dinghuensis]RAJ83128.1 TonB-linked SusC/RagA family outer membrane protein [Chitinophaga dinghuensis]
MRKLLLVVAGILLLASSLLAQNPRTVAGRVTDETGALLQGVTVSYPGGKTGTVTNAKGEFTLTLPTGIKQLRISMVGYETKLVPITGENLQVTLGLDSKSISEVVVVGYGTQRKTEVTGSISSVKGSAIAEMPIQSFEAGLGGRATGVQISVPNGVVNNPPVFRIRGVNSLSLSAYPLIIIDGIPTFTGDQGATNAPLNPLASVNPADIASIEIAKDAAATAIYGSRAASGVVFITTKKGKLGKAKFNYDGWVGWTSPTRLPKLLNAKQYIEIKNEGLLNKDPAATNLYVPNTDANGNMIDQNWYDIVYRSSGFSQSHSFNASGATENTNYYLSGGYTKQEGILRRNDFGRKNMLFNVDQKIGKILSVGTKLSYSNEESLISGSSGSLEGEAFNSGGLARLAFLTSPITPAYKNDGTYNVQANGNIGGIKNTNSVGIYNPKVLLDLDHSNTESNHIQGSVYAQLKPFEWMTLKTVYGIDYMLMDNNIYRNNISGDGVSPKGDAFSIYTQLKRWVWTNTAQFDRSFGSNSFNLLLGLEQQRDTRQRYGLERQFQSDNYFNTTQGGWLIDLSSGLLRRENYLMSAFSRLNYNYKEKYFLSGNLRQDQYSALAPGHKKGVFYGFSAGWEVSKEHFFTEGALGNIFSNFKLRGSYGKVGNMSGLGDYDFMFLYHPLLYGGNNAMYFNQSGNRDLGWEQSKKTDVGVSFGILKNRINFEFAYYYNNIDGLILYLTHAPSAGIPSTIPANVGSMFNKGLEASVNATVLDKGAFSWNSSFNFTYNKNQITSLVDGITEIPMITSSLEQTSINKVGYPVGMIYCVPAGGVDPATGRRILYNPAGEAEIYNPLNGAYTYLDGKPAQSLGAKTAQPYANTNPRFLGGFENTFRYKGFELNIMLTYQAGFSVYYGSNAGLRDQRYWNNSTDVLRRWQKPGDITDIPRLVNGDNVSNGSAYAISTNVFKGDFVKLRTIGLSYNLPAEVTRLAHISGARVYAQGQNLAIWTKYPGPDPEVSSNGNNPSAQGVDRNTLANGRTVTVGVNINF